MKISNELSPKTQKIFIFLGVCLFSIPLVSDFYDSYIERTNINKYIEIHNEYSPELKQFLLKYIQSTLSYSAEVLNDLSEWKDVQVNFPKTETEKIINLTNKMINDWCPLLKATSSKCEYVHEKLLSIIEKIEKQEYDALLEFEMKTFNSNYEQFISYLEKFEWITFKN